MSTGKSNVIAFTTRPVMPPRGQAKTSADSEMRNAQLATIIESSADAIFSTGVDDRILTWNPGAVALFGYTEEEAIGRTVDELIVPEHLIEQRRELYRDVRGGRVAIKLESECRRKDGTLVPVEINASPMFGDNGFVAGLALIMRDITERRRAEPSSRERERQGLSGAGGDSVESGAAGSDTTVQHELAEPIAEAKDPHDEAVLGARLPPQPFLWGAAAAVLTLVAALLGLRLQVDGIALFWPAAGVVAGLLIVAPAHAKWAVAAGAILALTIGNISQGRSLATSLVFMTGNLTQAVLLAWLLSRTIGSTARLDLLRAVGVFVALAMSVPAVVAVFTSIGLLWSGHTKGDFASSWWIWTNSHAAGLLVTAPAVMLLRSPVRLPRRFWIEHLAVALYIAVTALIASTLQTALDPRASLLLGLALLGPVVWWICQRASVERAAIAVLIAGTWVIWDAAGASFLHASPQEALASVVATAALLLALGAWQERVSRAASSVAVSPDQKPTSGSAAVIDTIRRAQPDFSHLALFYSVYLLGAGLTQSLTTLSGTWISIWPPNGFLLALFLVNPKASWPWWAMIAVIGELTGNALWYGNPLPLALLFCAGNTIEAAMGAWLVARFCSAGWQQGTLRDTVCLIVLGAGVAPAIGASVNSVAAVFEGKQGLADSWMRLWTGDATGILIGAPIVLAVFNGWTAQIKISQARTLEAAAVAVLFVGVVVLSLNGQAPLAYGVIPVLLWTAVRFGHAGAAAAAGFLALATAAFTVSGVSPFATPSPTSLNQELQLFLAVSSLSGLLVAALSYDLQSALARLRNANESLELRVADRTATLAVSEQRHRTLIDATSAVTWSCPPSGLHVVPQPAWTAFTGQSAEEMLGAGWTKMLHPDDATVASEGWSRAAAEGEPYLSEHRIRRHDGEWRWTRVHAVPVRRDGEIVEWFGMHVDITERKRREANLAFLSELGQSLVLHETSEDLARIATQRIAEFVGALRCALVDIDEAQDRADVYYDHAADGLPSLVGSYQISEFHSEQERAQLASGQPVIISDTGAERTAAATDRFGLLGIGALANIPHMRHGRCKFVLSVARSKPTQWRDDEVELLREAAARVHTRLERARAEERLGERSRQLNLLARTSQKLLFWREGNDRLLESIFRDIADHLGFEIFYHYQPADEPLKLRLAACDGITATERQSIATIGYGEHLCGRVAETRERLIVEDLQHSAQPGSEALAAAGAKSYAGFPLLTNGELFGTIAFVSRERVQLRDGETLMVQSICDQLATMQERSRLERELHDSERRFQLSMEATSDGLWDWDVATNKVYYSPSYFRLLGYEPDGFPSTLQAWQERIHPDDLERVLQVHWDCADGNSGSLAVEYRMRTRSGNWRWMLSRGKCVTRDTQGRASRLIGTDVDITERKASEQRLRAAHDTFRQLVEQSPFGIYAIDADFRIVQVGKGARKVFETVRPLIGRDLGEVLRILWSEPFASEAIARFRHTLATGEPYAAESSEPRADVDATEAYDWKIERITMPDGRPGVVCHFYDLSERKRHEEHVQLLMREINHRSKNMLTLVEAMARHTAAKRPEEFIETFGERVRALAASQDLLVKSDWKAVRLGDLVRSQLAHFGSRRDARFMFEGPTVELTASAAQTLGMALHELATNAAKHGALSNETGRVAVSWSVRSDAMSGRRFTMSWIESGGPLVGSPSRRGFGSTVIGNMIKISLGCDADIDFAPNGFVWRIDCPAEAVLESHSTQSVPL